MTVPPPRISIAMATYNGARYLAAQLDSLAAQTLPPAELVVTDDGSTDATVEIVNAFAARAPFPVRVHASGERLGWRGNFIRAAGLCTGDLIALCDQDDLWYPHKLATMARAFDDPAVLLAFHNADLVDAAGTPYDTLLPIADAVERITPLARPTPWSNPLGLTLLFRRALTRFDRYWAVSVDRDAPQHPAAHDQFFYHLATNLGAVVSVPDRLLGYRQHGANVVGFAHADAHLPLIAPPQAIRARIEPVLLMLRAFTAILAAAEADGLADAFPLLPAARAQNTALLARLERRIGIYDARSLPRRAALAAGLLARGAYFSRSDWALGRRALLADLLVGVLRPARTPAP